MASKFFLGDIVSFKNNNKTLVEGKVVDVEWYPSTKKFVYIIQAKDYSEYSVGEPAVKRVPDCKRKEKWQNIKSFT